MYGAAVAFEFHGNDTPREETIRRGLSAVGLRLLDIDQAPDAAYRILCFCHLDPDLFTRLRRLRGRPHRRVLALAASRTALNSETAWHLLQSGAADVLAYDDDEAAGYVRAKLDRWRTVEALTAEAIARESLVGQSHAWLSLVERIVEAARFSSDPILLTGESGTGKELLARLVHAVGCPPRDGAPSRGLVTVDCSTIVPELSGSELFGHERGAFTGAHNLREGAFALADSATLFLDEIGELSLPLQAQLLRAIQEKTYKRVGGNVWLKTDFRLVCATNRDLRELVHRGLFRLDLYYRIAGWVFRTPCIDERRDDILPLAHHFLSAIFSGAAPELDAAVRDCLLNRSYAGNIRELRQLVQRIAHRHAGPGPITPGDVPEEDRPAHDAVRPVWNDDQLDRVIADAIAAGATLKDISGAAANAAIRLAVASEDGNLQRAARRLGVTDRALQLRRAAGTLRH